MANLPSPAHAPPGPEHWTGNRFVDADHPSVQAFAARHAGGLSPHDAAVALFYAVRDTIPYNPWGVAMTPQGYTASGVLGRPPGRGGHCIDKANLLAAACRASGVASRLHFANVRNHLGTSRLEAHLGTDLLVFHGYAELWLGDTWVAATPAFDAALCARLGVAPLEFDGVEGCVFQEYDGAGGRFMEYVEDHGSHPDIPFDAMIAAWKQHYPHIMAAGTWPRPEDTPPG